MTQLFDPPHTVRVVLAFVGLIVFLLGDRSPRGKEVGRLVFLAAIISLLVRDL